MMFFDGYRFGSFMKMFFVIAQTFIVKLRPFDHGVVSSAPLETRIDRGYLSFSVRTICAHNDLRPDTVRRMEAVEMD